MSALACPSCQSAEDLWSIEVATILYPVKPVQQDDGTVDPGYTGDSSETYDESAVYRSELTCRRCGIDLAEADLVAVTDD